MKATMRNTVAVTASMSLLALVGCGDTSNDAEDTDNAEAAPDVEDVPALSEIDELMWESMEQAGSVTIVADLSDMAEIDPESADMFGEIFGSEHTEFSIYGDLDGSATAVSIDGSDLIIALGGDEAYISADAIFGMLTSQIPGMSDEEEDVFAELSEEFSGKWLDYSEELQSDAGGDDFNIDQLFSELRSDWTSEDETSDTPVDREEISDEGSHEVRDDADVWVYEGEEEGQELVLAADHDAPKIVELSDDEMSMAFTDWGETEAPQAPDESDVMTEQELEESLMEAMMGSSLDSDDSGASD